MGGAGVQWSFQITQFLVDALRSLEPSSFGVVMARNELRFRVNRDLRPRLRSYVALRAVSMTSGQTAINVQRRDYAAGEAGLEWQTTRSFRVVGTYDYTWQRFEGEPNAISNAVTLSVVYQPVSRFEPISPMSVPKH